MELSGPVVEGGGRGVHVPPLPLLGVLLRVAPTHEDVVTVLVTVQTKPRDAMENKLGFLIKMERK